MKKFVIATHGQLSQAFVDTVDLIVGNTAEIQYFCMTKSKSAQEAKAELKEILTNKEQGDIYIVLTDILGGSVTNICMELLLEFKDFELITGVNLPMVISMIMSMEGTDIETTIRTGIEEGQKGIVHMTKKIILETEE